jgi:hypothetical protein
LPPRPIKELKGKMCVVERSLRSVLLAEVLSRSHEVFLNDMISIVQTCGVRRKYQSGPRLRPAPGLKTTVGVDPQLLGLKMSEHLLDAVLNLLHAGNTGGVDVVNTGADVAGVLLVIEDL